MKDIYRRYKIETDFPILKELLNLHIEVTDVLYIKRDAVAHVMLGWKYMPTFMKNILILDRYTFKIVDTEGNDDMDIYEILWDKGMFTDLVEFFRYDFLDDVRRMSEEEFKEVFGYPL